MLLMIIDALRVSDACIHNSTISFAGKALEGQKTLQCRAEHTNSNCDKTEREQQGKTTRENHTDHQGR